MHVLIIVEHMVCLLEAPADLLLVAHPLLLAGRVKKAMRKFLKKNWQIVFAAAMSLVVITANLLRLPFNPGPDGILYAIAAMSSSIVALMVFVVAATAILGNARKNSFEEVLDEELDSFVKRHSPFISVIDDYTGAGDKNGALFGILKHHEDLLRKGEVFSPELYTHFFSLPPTFAKGSQIIFYFDEETFAAALGGKKIDSISNLRKDIANSISCEFSSIVKAHAFSEATDKRLYINLNKDFDTPEEAHEILHLLDYVFIHYLAIA